MENNQSQTTPVVSVPEYKGSVDSAKEQLREKLDKETLKIQKEQVSQGKTNSKNSTKLTLVLNQLLSVLSGGGGKNNVSQPLTPNDPINSIVSPNKSSGINDVIKRSFKDAVDVKTDPLRSLGSKKGLVGLAAGYFGRNPNSILGQVLNNVHSYMDDKDKFSEEKDKFKENYISGTEAGRNLKEEMRNSAEFQASIKGKNLSEPDIEKKLNEAVITKNADSLDSLFDEKVKMTEELHKLSSQRKQMKESDKNFDLSSDQKELENSLVTALKNLGLGKSYDNPLNPKPQSDEKPSFAYDPEPDHEKIQAVDDARDAAIAVFKKNENIEGNLNSLQEAEFERQYAANKKAKQDTIDKNNRIAIANNLTSKAMDEENYENIRPAVELFAKELDPNNEGDILPEHLDSAKQQFFSEMFQEQLEELKKLTSEQLQVARDTLEEIKSDNAHDKDQEISAAEKADDLESKISKANSGEAIIDDNKPSIINKTQLFSKAAPETKDENEDKEGKSGSILDKISDLIGGKGGKLGKVGNLLKSATPWLMGGAAVAGAGYLGYQAGTALHENQGENIQDAIATLTGSDKELDAKIADNQVAFAKQKIAAGEPISADLASKVKGKIEVPDDMVLKPGQRTDEWKKLRQAPIPPEKPEVLATKDAIDAKTDAVQQAKDEKELKKSAPNITNAPVVNTTNNNNNTTITREPIRPDEVNYPWRNAVFN